MPIAVPLGPSEVRVICSAPRHTGERQYMMPAVKMAVEPFEQPVEGGTIHWICPTCDLHQCMEVDEDELFGFIMSPATYLGEPVTMVLPGLTLADWLQLQSLEPSAA